jgi:hypothetical protein
MVLLLGRKEREREREARERALLVSKGGLYVVTSHLQVLTGKDPDLPGLLDEGSRSP